MTRSKPPPSRARRLPIAVVFLLPMMAAAPLAAERSEQDRQREEFLSQAQLVRTETIEVGVTAPLRATLTHEGFTHDAHIQRIDANLKNFTTKGRVYASFIDSFRFNIAAYRLDRLLDLDMVPVSVQRRYRGRRAAFTWWVDDVLMTDAKRFEDQIPAPDGARWRDQKLQTKIFNELVYNMDPNLGNFLIDKDWRLWMIDFSRAFRRRRELREPRNVQRIDRRLYDGLRGLTYEELRSETTPHLTKDEARAVMARRDAILDLLAAKIAANGEAAVICDLPGH